jgi:hypothetical protein
MEDGKVARIFLSAVIGEEVTELDFGSQEYTVRRSTSDRKVAEKTEREGLCLTVCRYDFTARIATADGGFRTVLIELQKAKLMSDIMRFRRYLGRHYQNPDNTYGENGQKARQIYCIFLLGHDIGIPGCPVIRVNYDPEDMATGEKLSGIGPEGNEFIRGLHHRSWIIQTGQLKQRRRNDLEKLLSIFDQTNRTRNHYILNVNEDDFPEHYRPIIRRLRMASESENIQIEMEMEDDYLKELQDKERFIDEQGRMLAEKTKALEEKDKALGEKDKVLEEKDKVLEEKDKALEELRKQLAELRKSIK